jgi:NAD(P)-dependent dehydrogenase (short-subunit alcohol dehydrogenase family)
VNDFRECRSVVTGGASGIGFPIASELISRGARVVIADVEAPALDKCIKTDRSASDPSRLYWRL